MPWKVEYLESALKSVRKIDRRKQRRIHDYLETRVVAQDNPRNLGRALKGQMTNLWRYRVGDYRIICELRDVTLVVLVIRVEHRKDIYE